ncbi:hypothetical protein NUW58_g179 [Xylaria curta]|uniref:Uncharacterized protein n=1 Tax=Xylaria curta TaxID=42375 RepID=A0ACC1PR68_9PEZI|nr:hypothetical protein NUW58_g179 [Xylaria curta]
MRSTSSRPPPALKSRSPGKRSATGTPKQQPMDDADETEFDDMLAPQDTQIDTDEAKRVESSFRSSCLNRGSRCVISGEGNPWCPGAAIGPGVEACHIIPQRHYYLYPAGGHDDDLAITQPSPRSLRLSWEKTWCFKNGILLMKHFHNFFDGRLFSIHPKTLRIRVFVPYDALLRFNGQTASVPQQVDRRALRQHYEMSCIENMAALKIYWRGSLSKTSVHTSGTRSVLSPSTNLPLTPDPRDTQLGTFLPGASDPSKKPPPIPPNQGRSGDASGQNNLPKEAEAVLWTGETGSKRRRLQECEVQYEDVQDSYITPWNRREFLADVNWELRRFKARQYARGNLV